MTMEDNVAEANGPDFGNSRIQLMEDAPPVFEDTVQYTIPLNSPTDPIMAQTNPTTSHGIQSHHPAHPSPMINPAGSANSLLEYFAFRDGGHTLATAVEKCLPVILQSQNADGNLIGVWTLTEISHWDVDQERLVFLTEHTLIIAKYDLIQMALLEYRRIPLQVVDKIMFGALRYPEKSILEERNQIGVRLVWNSTSEIPLSQKWNPFSEQPYVTLASHNAVPIVASVVPAVLNLPTSIVPPTTPPAIEASESTAMAWCRVEDFKNKVKLACDAEAELSHRAVQYQDSDILIENYAGIISRVFNVAQLGFFKSRGRISF